jgi:hypothetical protein
MTARNLCFVVALLCISDRSLSAQQYVKDVPPDMSGWTVTKTSNYSTGCGVFFKEYMIRKDLVDPETYRAGVVLLSGSLLKESKPVLIGWEDEGGETRVALRREEEIGGWLTGYYTFETTLIWKKGIIFKRCTSLQGVEISLFLRRDGKDHFMFGRTFPSRFVP